MARVTKGVVLVHSRYLCVCWGGGGRLETAGSRVHGGRRNGRVHALSADRGDRENNNRSRTYHLSTGFSCGPAASPCGPPPAPLLILLRLLLPLLPPLLLAQGRRPAGRTMIPAWW